MFISMFDVVPRSLKLNLCNIFVCFYPAVSTILSSVPRMSSSVSPILFSQLPVYFSFWLVYPSALADFILIFSSFLLIFSLGSCFLFSSHYHLLLFL